MPVTLTCPRCMHKQTLDDDKAGKEVPCKICHHNIAPQGSAKPKTKSKLASPHEEKITENGKKTGFQAPPPVAGKKTNLATDTDSVDEPRSKSKASPRRTQKSSDGIMMYVLMGGGFLLLVFLCAGGGLSAYFLMSGPDNKANEPIAQVNVQPDANFNQPVKKNFPPPVPNPPANPIPVQEALNPNDPNAVDRVILLLQGPEQDRGPAFTWLQNANPDNARRNEVAKLLEAMVDNQVQQPFANFAFFPAYFRWATKDNAPTLIRMVDNDDQRRKDAIATLGKLKSASASEAIARRLPNFFDRAQAADALKEIGPAAQSAVLKYYNHHDGGTRDLARRLISGYNTSTELIVDQCLTDLASFERGTPESALQWFAKNAVEPTRRVAVSKAFNQLLDKNDALRSQDLVKALEIWGSAENTPQLLTYFNHPDAGQRKSARKILDNQAPETSVYVTQCLADLEALDANRRNASLQWFAKNPADPALKLKVAKALNKNIENENSFHNRDLSAALDNWGTSVNVPPLTQILDEAKFAQPDIIRILGKIRDPAGIKAVARRLGNFFDAANAKKTLKEIGVEAEPAVVEILTTTTDSRVRTEVTRLLGDIGTPAVGAAAIQNLVQQNMQVAAPLQDRNFLSAAKTALNSIAKRAK